jgi:hypothetical protein
MAAFKGILTGARKYGGEILKLIGLTTVADKVTKATGGMSDTFTVAVIAGIALLIFGGRR